MTLEDLKGDPHNQSLLPFQNAVKIFVLGLHGVIGLDGRNAALLWLKQFYLHVEISAHQPQF